eukprot:CAMPEP_0174739668 /NCGR_PEP_ID=MMETSP1094-20130205/72003_1 /TAXON_ID=156173 /ORGANISM="Chrysochromulina brevifilum, Strain UTEX LB 985" /LENGTH=209 /DNA_ID=CAMNT_0015943257 /DNA_START=88 /DNA_END=718 /DNA_ORIENTATION=-
MKRGREVIDLTEDDDDDANTADPATKPTRDCPVCMDTLGSNGPARALGCVHVYCELCIRQHITTQLQATRLPACPICKRVVPPEEQHACGVEPREAAGAAAYGPRPVDMFAPDDGPLVGADLARIAAIGAAFPHANALDVRRNRDPMLLLDRHMVHQRRDRSSGANHGGSGGGGGSHGGSGGGRGINRSMGSRERGSEMGLEAVNLGER